MLDPQRSIEPTEPLPPAIDSPQAKLVYLYLEATGGATATDLARALSMKKIAILSVLNALSSQGLVEKVDAKYATVDR
ncbi:helix-turn-helix domain-containing protein [Natronobacterium gregoryi]|uniref:Transcriptional regulator n=2 Tax=Natronobacterium gregoryi TaxID=44930 RepID=L0AI65_NATGS|nr:helix-turn-helix domain-containing protein [Natronobacterium gregoryi]AFZ72867.1 putative transcriptional regulator [Natronobacterium gregoryi SP2]ELY69643.1 hypothetical protein C490_07561 [Natronobacterium gregoryi SP2]PLK21904.1 MarR family transcriptional regulator [Natronobacterium gregoryi SP2]SFI66035.1 Sugar-specific transcriptional regulator TrmB [Natronobacterium gregoryi]